MSVTKIQINQASENFTPMETICFIVDSVCKDGDGWLKNTIYDIDNVWGPLKGIRLLNPTKASMFAIVDRDGIIEIDVRKASEESENIINKIKAQLG